MDSSGMLPSLPVKDLLLAELLCLMQAQNRNGGCRDPKQEGRAQLLKGSEFLHLLQKNVFIRQNPLWARLRIPSTRASQH